MDASPKILSWRKNLVLEQTRSSSHWLLDYVSGEGDFCVAMMEGHWSVKGVEVDDEKRRKSLRRYGMSVISPCEMSNLDELSFGAVTVWNGFPEHGYVSMKDALDRFHKVLVENGSLFLALPSEHFKLDDVKLFAAESDFGVDSFFAQPEEGFLSVFKNISNKKHPEKSSVIVYHLKKTETLNFHVF